MMWGVEQRLLQAQDHLPCTLPITPLPSDALRGWARLAVPQGLVVLSFSTPNHRALSEGVEIK